MAENAWFQVYIASSLASTGHPNNLQGEGKVLQCRDARVFVLGDFSRKQLGLSQASEL